MPFVTAYKFELGGGVLKVRGNENLMRMVTLIQYFGKKPSPCMVIIAGKLYVLYPLFTMIIYKTKRDPFKPIPCCI